MATTDSGNLDHDQLLLQVPGAATSPGLTQADLIAAIREITENRGGESFEVNTTAVRLPAFNKASPEAWFDTIECTFRLKKVTNSQTKFDYAVERLDQETAATIAEFLREEANTRSYKRLRDILVGNFAPTKEQRLEEVLGPMALGDRKPTRLLLDIQRMISGLTMEDLTRKVFLKALPTSLRGSIAGTQGDLRSLAAAADQAWGDSMGQATTSVTAVTSQPNRERDTQAQAKRKKCWQCWKFGDRALSHGKNCPKYVPKDMLGGLTQRARRPEQRRDVLAIEECPSDSDSDNQGNE